MKIAYLYDYSEGGTNNVADPIARLLNASGHHVDTFAVDKGRGLAQFRAHDYDLIHAWNIRTLDHCGHVSVPVVATIHHLPYGYEDHYFERLSRYEPEHIHVMDRFAQRQLGQRGLCNVTHITQTFDHSRFTELAEPSAFTVGALGTDADGMKRLQVVRDCPYPKVIHDSSDWRPWREVQDFYKRISVFVCASFNDAGPLPAQEALLCGRPVVTTPVGQMTRIINGLNGLFFNGTTEDLTRKLDRIFEDYDYYRRGALRTVLPSPIDVLPEYERMYLEVVA